ncbi:MAG: hypothetical protein QY317_16305 [Candidatus Jettenia caeni]|nr:MAG: hypothetical protein QY317_16305 [Candidatus Jettenia caeni]
MKVKKPILISELARGVFLRQGIPLLKRWMDKNNKTSTDIAKITNLSASGVRRTYQWKDMSKRTCMLIAKAFNIPPEIIMFPERYDTGQLTEKSVNDQGIC